ncbi:hypothetical protein K445DRAFT_47957, partial [Daldinia sp. EC12]
MSRTLEPTLLSLLPTYSQDLPQPLLELASSLLTQSRHSAGALRAEEEVARTYACAHIACERLKITLDLPPIQPRPPVPPRIYKRLYTHLNNVLPANAVGRSGRVRTPSSKLREAGTLGSDQRIPSRGTPTKEESLAKFRSPTALRVNGTPTKSASKPPPIPAKRKAGGSISALPAWVRPTIQFMCKELDEERIGRVVLAGMQTIATPHGKRTKDEWVNEHLTPLLAAVYFLVSSQNVSVTGMDEDELWIGWSDIKSRDVDGAVAKVVENGWQEEEWFAGIKHMVKTKNTDVDGEDEGMEDGNDGQFSGKLHIQRGDTMLQSKWDVTDKKREEYRAWKDEMMRRIQ